jgi:hypothetical protein
MTRSIPSRLFISVALIALGATCRGDEQKIPLAELPKVVLDAVKAKFPAAELKEAAKETERGKTTFEVSLKDKGAAVDVIVSAEGKITEIERALDVKDLPTKVRSAINAKYPKSTVKKAEERIEFEDGEEERSHEVQLVTADGKTLEVVVDENGKVEVENDGETR